MSCQNWMILSILSIFTVHYFHERCFICSNMFSEMKHYIYIDMILELCLAPFYRLRPKGLGKVQINSENKTLVLSIPTEKPMGPLLRKNI